MLLSKSVLKLQQSRSDSYVEGCDCAAQSRNFSAVSSGFFALHEIRDSLKFKLKHAHVSLARLDFRFVQIHAWSHSDSFYFFSCTSYRSLAPVKKRFYGIRIRRRFQNLLNSVTEEDNRDFITVEKKKKKGWVINLTYVPQRIPG